jgi:subtilisin family serine protease/PKD repeat protein
MKRIAVAAAALTLAAACQDAAGPRTASPGPQPGQPSLSATPAGEVVPGQYIIVLRESVTDVQTVAREIAARHSGALRFTYTHALKGFTLNVSAEAAALIAADPRVAYVEQDKVVRAIETQTGATWGIDRIDQRDLPLSTTYVYNATGAGVDAYIIDTGMLLTHNEFTGRAVAGTDALDNDPDPTDCNGHGTHVAGTVGGTTYGVAKAVRLIAVRVLDCGGGGTDASVIAGIDWATGHHVAGQPAVANMSLGGGFSQALNDAVTNSVNDGVVYAVAAGNGYTDACDGSPASTAAAMTVGATDINDKEAVFSDRGPCLDIWAPGVNITSAWIGSNTATETISGTSMATPHVAGAAALYLESNPTASAADVDNALSTNATTGKITWQEFFPGIKPPPPPAGQDYLLYTGFITGTPPTPPAAPSNLVATPASHSQINLSWSDNSDNESSFKIERCLGVGCTNFTQVATTGPNANSYQDTGLDATTTYRYQVRASNGGGDSDYSNVAEATTLAAPTPPAAPSNLTATPVSNSQINLAWSDNSGNESGFKIERCTGATCTNFAPLTTVGPGVTAYQNTGLAVGTTYRYRVSATNDGGDSDYSNIAAATTFDNAPVSRFTWSCNSKGGRGCTFNGTSSTDDKGIVSYNWDFGDGTTGTGSTVSKTYASRGTYTVTLTVSDGVNPGQPCGKAVSTGTSGSCP